MLSTQWRRFPPRQNVVNLLLICPLVSVATGWTRILGVDSEINSSESDPFYIMVLRTDIFTILRKFHCIFPQTPCMNNPCQHGTSFCRPIYNQDDYQCVCNEGFTGKHCGMGQFNFLLSDIHKISHLRVASKSISQAYVKQESKLSTICPLITLLK